jgi:hypothetical protein
VNRQQNPEGRETRKTYVSTAAIVEIALLDAANVLNGYSGPLGRRASLSGQQDEQRLRFPSVCASPRNVLRVPATRRVEWSQRWDAKMEAQKVFLHLVVLSGDKDMSRHVLDMTAAPSVRASAGIHKGAVSSNFNK